MIDIKHLRQKYHRAYVIDDLDLTLPRHGLIGILGPSGSGKSSFLKILAGLLPFEGKLLVQSRDFGALSYDGRLDWRLTQIGLLYQSYRLFENEAVAWNLGLPLRLLGYRLELIDRHVTDWLKRVGLIDYRNRRVSTLSGGEKQRLAAARTLIKQPRIILADEPTAALDRANKMAIFDLFSQMKEQRLIVVVSHEKEFLDQYADTIYRLQDGKILDSYQSQNPVHMAKKVSQRLPGMIRRGRLPWSFCYRHAISDMKAHRWRHRWAQAMLTLALLGTGIGLHLATNIPQKMATTFNHMMGQPGLQITSNQRPLGYLETLHGAEEDSLQSIMARYADYELRMGVSYRHDINSLFPDRNQIFIMTSGPIVTLPSFQARHLADSLTFKEMNIAHEDLADDEIFLATPETDMKMIARQLRCEDDESAINLKLTNQEVFVGAGFANFSWQYEDEQLWRLAGIVTSERALILHSNPRFNEFVFETSMRFPTSHDLEGPLERPWVLRKVFCLLYDGDQNILKTLSQDIALKNYRFDAINQNYLPTYCPRFGPCPLQRYPVLFDPWTGLNEAEIAYIQKMEPDLAPSLIGTEGGYLIHPEAMISGFAHETFVAGHVSAIEQAIDWFTWTEPAQELDRLPPGTIRGYYQDQSDKVLRLRPCPDSGYHGFLPVTTNEIAISTGLAQVLFGRLPDIGTTMHYATRFVVGQEQETIRSEFHRIELTITALVDDKKMNLYGSPLWSRRFFIEQMGLPEDTLRPLTVMFEGNPDQLEASAQRIKRTFPHLDIGFPMADLHRQIKTITTNIHYVVVAMAGFAGVNALVLAILVTNLSWVDMAKDRRLLFEMGASSDNARQLMVARIVWLFGYAFAMAVLGVVSASIPIEKMLAEYFSTPMQNTFPWLAVTMMLALTLMLGSIVMGINRFRRPEH